MEAKWLFDVDLDHIRVVVQPKSIYPFHGGIWIELLWHSLELGYAPSQYALYYPEEISGWRETGFSEG